MTISPKSRLAATLFAFFLGMFGAHRFYVGKTGTAIAQVVITCSVLLIPVTVIWTTIDFIMIVAGAFKDKQGRLITVWDPAANIVQQSSQTQAAPAEPTRPIDFDASASTQPAPDMTSSTYTPPVGDSSNESATK